MGWDVRRGRGEAMYLGEVVCGWGGRRDGAVLCERWVRCR